MKTLKKHLFILVLVIPTVILIACSNDDEVQQEPTQVTSTPIEIVAAKQVTSMPVEIIAAKDAEITGNTTGFQEYIQLNKPCLLTINTNAEIEGMSGVGKLTVYVKLNDKLIAVDGSNTRITNVLVASASTTIFLQPGTYDLKVDRYLSGSYGTFSLKINYHAVYAEMAN